MNRQALPLAMLLPFAAVLPPASARRQRDAARPNIVFIMSDDHAAHAIRAYGSRLIKRLTSIGWREKE